METYVSGADVTRRALIEAALQLFGERGYDAVSTREIADHAAANIGSIAYHFGGKPGLRRAAADHVINSIKGLAGPLLTMPLPRLGAAEATAAIEQMLKAFVEFIVSGDDGKMFVNFMMREVMQPGEVFDRVYADMVKPLHARICLLISMATGMDAESEETRILVFSMVGQAIYFHIGRAAVLKRMDWEEVGQKEADRISAVLIGNLRAIIAEHRRISEGLRP